MINKSETIVNLSKAILAFQGAVGGVKRDSDNPFFKSKYADLEKVVDTARPHLQAAGIAFLQSPGAIHDGNLEMTTMLIHAESGEWIEGTGDIPLGKKDPQGAGSAQTYAQRYHLMAMLGLPPTDDDGEGAMERNRPIAATERPTDAPSTPQPDNAAPRPKAQSRPMYAEMQAEIDACSNIEDLVLLWGSPSFQFELKRQPADWQIELTERKDQLKASLQSAAGMRV